MDKTMEDFYTMTIGTIIALKDNEIDKYATSIGKDYVSQNLKKIELQMGRKIVKSQIKKLKEIMESPING